MMCVGRPARSSLTLQLDNARKDANEGKNDAASRWQRGGMYAGRLTGGENGEEGEASDADGPNQKLLCVGTSDAG